MPFGMWTLVRPRNYVLDDGPGDAHGTGHFWGDIGFSRIPPSAVRSGRDVGISPHDVDQRYSCPAECHIKFPMNNHRAMRPLVKTVWPLIIIIKRFENYMYVKKL